MNIEGVVKYQEIESVDDENSGSALDINSGSGSGIQRSEKKFTVHVKACLSLYHGFDIDGEIYPWYRVSLLVSYRCSVESKSKHPRYKKKWLSTKKALLKKI